MKRLRLTGHHHGFRPFVAWCGQPEQITGTANVYMTTTHAGMAVSSELQWVDRCPCDLAQGCAALAAERKNVVGPSGEVDHG